MPSIDNHQYHTFTSGIGGLLILVVREYAINTN